MKIKCIDNTGILPLAIGKIYDAINPQVGDVYYTIIDDEGCDRHYKKFRFLTMQEVRQQKLDQLVDNV